MIIKLLFSLVIGTAAVSAPAQTITDIPAKAGDSAYAQDGKGIIMRNPYGLCWRTGYWTPADGVAGCDGQLAPPVAKITAPEIPAPPTAAPASTVNANLTPKRCDFTITLENDQTFVFGKAVLSKAAKRRIDEEVLSKLAACTKIENVTITGHADRIGTRHYNQKLSEKRAETVAAYLKSRNAASDIQTIGAGETQSVEICDDKPNYRLLIQCLAPNRRVVIDVKGTVN